MIEQLKFIYRAYRYRLSLERQEIRYMREKLKKGQIGVDIGAHKGAYVYWMIRCVKEDGKVYAFEPQDQLFSYLRKIITAFKLRNVRIENLAVSDKSGFGKLFIPQSKSGSSPGATLNVKNDLKDIAEQNIKSTTIDEYFLESDLEPDFIKIDVEGHEKQVLLGAQETIRKYHPNFLMECEERHLNNETPADIFKILTDQGYSGFFFLNRQKIPISKFDPAKHQKRSFGSFWKDKNYVNNFIFEFV